MIEPRGEPAQRAPGRRHLLLATVLGPLALLPATAMWQLAIDVAAAGPRASAGGTLAAAAISGFLLGGFGLFVAFPLAVVYLLPVALVLRRWGRAGPLPLTAAGLVGGGPFGISEGAYSTAFFAYCGAAVAVAFWAIGRRALRRQTPAGCDFGPTLDHG